MSLFNTSFDGNNEDQPATFGGFYENPNPEFAEDDTINQNVFGVITQPHQENSIAMDQEKINNAQVCEDDNYFGMGMNEENSNKSDPIFGENLVDDHKEKIPHEICSKFFYVRLIKKLPKIVFFS